jgi:O-methyltransferase involved in polyketide biosynthesis
LAQAGTYTEHPFAAALAADADDNPPPKALGTVIMMVARTKFIDEKLERAIHDGATLGRILDTCDPLSEVAENDQVFEVDSAGTQERKRQRVDVALGGGS